MDFFNVIQNRYSCKKFSARQVEKEKLLAILEAGRVAPTAKNAQPYHVYVVTSQENLQKLDGFTASRYGAPTVLAVTFDKSKVYFYRGNKYDSGAEDCAIVATHMALAAEAVGVNSCWVNSFDPDLLKEALCLPQNEVVALLLDLGYKAEGGEPLSNHTKKKNLEELVSYL